jgi:tetratricopeptide (TPR) repeat protein
MSFNTAKPQIKEELHRKWAIQAVELALMGRWDEAEQANLRILEIFPDDTSARNRLGRAYSELGRYDEAATAYEQSLERQPSNSIARKKLTELYTLLKRDPAVALGESTPDSESTEEDEQEQEQDLEEERVQDGPEEDSNA